MSGPVRPGLAVLLDDRPELVDGCRVGLLAHAASVDSALCHAADRLAARPSVTLARLFGPEHGVTGAVHTMRAWLQSLSKCSVQGTTLVAPIPRPRSSHIDATSRS